MSLDQFVSLIHAAVIFGTVILFGCVGETLSEKAGNLNLGVPGVMYIGGIASLAGAFFYESSTDKPVPVLCLIIALACGFLASALTGLLFSFMTNTLRVNQNVTGLTITIMGTGIANFFGGSLNKLAGGVGQISVSATSEVFRQTIPGANTMHPLLQMIFNYGWMVYLALVIAIAANVFLSKTMTGLNLRAIGENPATADAAGINVVLYKYLATSIGCGICGLGGVFYVMDYTKGTWANDGAIEGLGWLAVALVIFALWKPVNAIYGAYLFGVFYWIYMYLNASRSSQELFKMLPYLVTIIVLIFISLRKKREYQAPEALGIPYFRDDR